MSKLNKSPRLDPWNYGDGPGLRFRDPTKRGGTKLIYRRGTALDADAAVRAAEAAPEVTTAPVVEKRGRGRPRKDRVLPVAQHSRAA